MRAFVEEAAVPRMPIDPLEMMEMAAVLFGPILVEMLQRCEVGAEGRGEAS